MNIKIKTIKSLFMILACILIMAPYVCAGNKKIMSTRAAQVLAERALIESVYGLKLRATEEVVDMVASSFKGKTESKTSAIIKGVKFDEVIYDSEKDIAKVTASVSLDSITNIDGNVMDLENKVFQRVAFATSTPSMTEQLMALRAAEIDAYTRLIKQIVGFDLESHTTVENFMLTSDDVKTKVMATLYLAEVVDYGWDEDGDAYVRMALNVEDASEILDEQIINTDTIIEVEGQGAIKDDFEREM